MLPTPLASDPYVMVYAADLPFDISLLTKYSDAIVIGTVQDVLPAQWGTPDGARPENPHDGYYHIYRPVLINIERVIKGKQQKQLYVQAFGGTIGQDSTSEDSNTPLFTFTKGERGLLFLSRPGDTYPPVINGLVPSYINDHYTLTETGQANSFHRHTTLNDLLKEIQTANKKQ